MATKLWSRSFGAAAFSLNSSVSGAAQLARPDAGYLRLAMPLMASGDISVPLPIGVLAMYDPAADLKVRVRCYSLATSMSYQLAIACMAKRPTMAGETEAFNVATNFIAATLPATARLLQDNIVAVPAGAARDNALDGDSLTLLLSLLRDAGRVTSEQLYIESIEVWQEIA